MRDYKKWIKSEFPSEKSLYGHFEKHSLEFPYVTKEAYQKVGANLLASPIGSHILGYEPENGLRVRYDKNKNVIAIGNLAELK